MTEDLGRVGRSNLLTLVRTLRDELEQARVERDHAVDMARRQMVLEGCLTCSGGAEYKAMLANLKTCQERCTSLLLENLELRGGALLPGLGWDCPSPACGIFNGDLKERLQACRSCGTARPT